MRRVTLLLSLLMMASVARATPVWTLSSGSPAEGVVEAGIGEEPREWTPVELGRSWPRSPSGIVWLRLAVRNDTAERRWHLYFRDEAKHEEITARVTGPEGTRVVRGGSMVPLAERAWRGAANALPLELAPGATSEVLLRIDSTSRWATNELRLATSEEFAYRESSRAALFALYLGFSLFAGILCVSHGVRLKDRGQLFYGLYCLTWALNVAAFQGFVTGFLAPGAPRLEFVVERLTIYAVPLVFLLFWRLALGLPRIAPRLDRVIVASIVVNAICVVINGAGVDGRSVRPWFVSLALVQIVLATTAAVIAVRKRAPQSWFYLAAIGCNIGVIVVIASSLFEVLPHDVSPYRTWVLLQFIEIVILTFAMVQRHHAVTVERDRALVVAAESDTLRTLLQVVTHDLANQLQGIFLLGQKLLRGATDDAAQERAKRLLGLAAHQKEIIEHVKTLRALRPGNAPLDIRPVLVADVLASVKLTFEEMLTAKGVTLRIDAPHDSVAVLAERSSLVHTVLGNVVSNAIKFSDPGDEVVLSVDAARESVTIRCVDQGVGIPSAIMPKIFEPAVTRPGTHGERGSGFGLPLVRSYVEHMSGNVRIMSRAAGESDQPPGTTVEITLRRASAS